MTKLVYECRDDDTIAVGEPGFSAMRVNGVWVKVPFTIGEMADDFRLILDEAKANALVEEARLALSVKGGATMKKPRLRKLKVSSAKPDDPIYSAGFIIGGKRLLGPKKSDDKSKNVSNVDSIMRESASTGLSDNREANFCPIPFHPKMIPMNATRLDVEGIPVIIDRNTYDCWAYDTDPPRKFAPGPALHNGAEISREEFLELMANPY